MPAGSGVAFRLEVELGSMPYAFFVAVEETVRETLGQGLHGWPVTDCVVTMTHSGYWPRQSHAHATFDKSMSSTAGDFRLLTPLVLMQALERVLPRDDGVVFFLRLYRAVTEAVERGIDFSMALVQPDGRVPAIGGADESYGLGPCWEMDYNIRAARAGFPSTNWDEPGSSFVWTIHPFSAV